MMYLQDSDIFGAPCCPEGEGEYFNKTSYLADYSGCGQIGADKRIIGGKIAREDQCSRDNQLETEHFTLYKCTSCPMTLNCGVQ